MPVLNGASARQWTFMKSIYQYRQYKLKVKTCIDLGVLGFKINASHGITKNDISTYESLSTSSYLTSFC